MASGLAGHMTTPCPQCTKPLPAKPERAFLPFCSERCKLLDLSKWLDGEYRIPGQHVPPQSYDEH